MYSKIMIRLVAVLLSATMVMPTADAYQLFPPRWRRKAGDFVVSTGADNLPAKVTDVLHYLFHNGHDDPVRYRYSTLTLTTAEVAEIIKQSFRIVAPRDQAEDDLEAKAAWERYLEETETNLLADAEATTTGAELKWVLDEQLGSGCLTSSCEKGGRFVQLWPTTEDRTKDIDGPDAGHGVFIAAVAGEEDLSAGRGWWMSICRPDGVWWSSA